MRIGIEHRGFNPAEAGQQRYLWRLGLWLAERNHDVHIISAQRAKREIEAPAGVTLHVVHDMSSRAVHQYIRSLALDVLLLNPERAPAFHGVGANVLRAGYGTEQYSQKMRSFRRPAEHALRAASRLAPWIQWRAHIERQFYERRVPAPDVIAQSGYMLAEIQRSYRVPSEQMHLVPNAVDHDEFAPAARTSQRDTMRARWGIPDGALCLLFIGHNFRLKGLGQLLTLMTRMDPQVHLLVAGRGTGAGQRRAALHQAAHLELGSRVVFAGPVHPSMQAYAAADALMHLSWHDSFGFVVLEAMACGLPVITTPWVGAAEHITHGESGFVVDPGDDAAILSAVDALRSAAYREQLGAAAVLRAAPLTEQHNFEQVEAVFRVAAARGPVT